MLLASTRASQEPHIYAQNVKIVAHIEVVPRKWKRRTRSQNMLDNSASVFLRHETIALV